MKFEVCRVTMGVNITTKYYEGPNTLSRRINTNENQRIIKIIYLTNKLYTNYEIKRNKLEKRKTVKTPGQPKE